MAIEALGNAAGTAETVYLQGLRPEPPIAGDLVIILVRDGEDVTAAGWQKTCSGSTWFLWRIVDRHDLFATMYAPQPREWYWEARAFRGTFTGHAEDWMTSVTEPQRDDA